jgi:Arc/MetJ family transcription regulator
MKTTISIDDDLVTQAMSITGSVTKKEAIENALKLFLAFANQKSIKNLKGKLKWVGNLEQMRAGR